ncbi:MAG: hypothetical protein DHS20C05_04040 [Hyphococcus sp.]|nr:MAG: hypothetical protein DHS20C05_04040 [Marinicaulis sp.]
MIKALILVHLWSLVVAGGAWVLQRDGNGPVGSRFPAPNVWLALIMLSFLPSVFYLVPVNAIIRVPPIEVFGMFPIQVGDSAADVAMSPNLLAVYMGLCILLMGRTLWRWSRLQGLALAPTSEPDIFTTTAALPPLTLSWPRKAVVMPQGFETRAVLLRHERAHLRHNDAELTLLLLLLQDMMLRNPGISFLVRQWRLSIELRADRAATSELTPPERKDYAAFLLNIQRPTRTMGEALPCPTARLTSAHHRNTKMRLIGILENETGARKRRWGAALLVTSIGASALGLTSALATAGASVINMASSPIDYVRQTPLQMPASCPGLIADIKRRGVEFEEKDLMVGGEPVSRHTINLGTVVLGHDVRKDGTIHNARVLVSTHPCFESEAKAAIAQWMAAPQEFQIKDAAVKLHFMMSAATREELNEKLKSYAQ